MRRLLLVLLLMFLPLQSVWAAAANYCAHEAAASGAHFGHPAHEHHDVGDDDKAGDKAGANSGKASSPDMDCHAHGMSNAPHQHASALPLWVQAMQLAPFVRFTLPTPSPQRPERPNWRPLA